jgi:hypothetical protein
MQDEKILKENYSFFVSQKTDLLKDPEKKDKFAVIYEKSIKGYFDSFELAYIWAKESFTDENYLIQQIISDCEITNFIYGSLSCQ